MLDAATMKRQFVSFLTHEPSVVGRWSKEQIGELLAGPGSGSSAGARAKVRELLVAATSESGPTGVRHSEVDVLRARQLQLLLDIYDKSTVAQCSAPVGADLGGDDDGVGEGDPEADGAFDDDQDSDSDGDSDGEAGNGADSRELQYTLLLRLMMANLQRSSKSRNLSPLSSFTARSVRVTRRDIVEMARRWRRRLADKLPADVMTSIVVPASENAVSVITLCGTGERPSQLPPPGLTAGVSGLGTMASVLNHGLSGTGVTAASATAAMKGSAPDNSLVDWLTRSALYNPSQCVLTMNRVETQWEESWSAPSVSVGGGGAAPAPGSTTTKKKKKSSHGGPQRLLPNKTADRFIRGSWHGFAVSHRQDDFEAGLPGLYSASVIPERWQVPAGVLIHVYDPGQSKQLGALSGADLLESQLPCADRSRRRKSLGQYLAAKAAKAAKEAAESPSHGQSASDAGSGSGSSGGSSSSSTGLAGVENDVAVDMDGDGHVHVHGTQGSTPGRTARQRRCDRHPLAYGYMPDDVLDAEAALAAAPSSVGPSWKFEAHLAAFMKVHSTLYPC